MSSTIITRKTTWHRDGIHTFVEDKIKSNNYLYLEEGLDETGNVLIKIEYDKKGEPQSRTETIYADGKVIEEKLYSYTDDSDKLIAETIPELNERTIYQHDDSGRVIEITKYKFERILVKQHIQYDSMGRLARESFFYDYELTEGFPADGANLQQSYLLRYEYKDLMMDETFETNSEIHQ